MKRSLAVIIVAILLFGYSAVVRAADGGANGKEGKSARATRIG